MSDEFINKMFSIVIVNFNHGKYIEKAICSVLEQSCTDYELILVDGSSTDNSLEIIQKYAEHFAWWISEPDNGQSDAFNKGFNKATGKYYLWLNADDLLLPGSLEAIRRYLSKHIDCKWLVADQIFFNDSNIITRCLYGPYWNGWLMKQAPLCNMVNAPSSVFQNTIFKNVGGMDSGLSYGMDLDLWIKFVNEGVKFHRIHRYVWAFRVHTGSKTSHSIGNKHSAEFRKEIDYILKRAGRVSTITEKIVLKIFKLITGVYLKSIIDTWKMKGLLVDKIYRSNDDK